VGDLGGHVAVVNALELGGADGAGTLRVIAEVAGAADVVAAPRLVAETGVVGDVVDPDRPAVHPVGVDRPAARVGPQGDVQVVRGALVRFDVRVGEVRVPGAVARGVGGAVRRGPVGPGAARALGVEGVLAGVVA